MTVIVLLVISILAESQETIPECHSYKVDQIRSDHLTLFVVGELRSYIKEYILSILHATKNNSPL